MGDMSKSDDRISIRLPRADKERLAAAAKAERRKLTGFILAAALDRADEVLGKEESGE